MYKSDAQRAYFNANRAKLEQQGVGYDVVGECWYCTSHRPNNSGYPCRHGETLNRFVYRKLIGEIPDGKQVLHTCDNRLCINPLHLWLGTHADNHRDKVAKQRQHRPKGTKNGRSKLTENQALWIRSDQRNIKLIAAEYGISFQVVSRIKRLEAWNAV
jgi:hypothetical protein